MGVYAFNPETGIIELRTKHAVYQMQIMKHRYLGHVYFGRDLYGTTADYRIVNLDRGFSPNPGDAGEDRCFSLDCLPQEYSGFGNGDYRSCALEVVTGSGDPCTDLRYVSHEFMEGKYSLPGLPALYQAEGEEAYTLKVLLEDEVVKLKVTLLYGIFPDLDVITRACIVENAGEERITLEKALSMQVDFLGRDVDMIHFHGRHSMERMVEREHLAHGRFNVGSIRGASSHQHNPFVILCDHRANEDWGACFGFSFVYSGNFIAEAEVDQLGQVRFGMGIHPEGFCWKLAPGESFVAPEVMLSYSEDGFADLSNRISRAFRRALIRSKYVRESRPVLVNNWEATYFDFDEEKLFAIATQAKELGLDLFVLDDGWFGKRDSDYTGLGDWYVNEEKIKGGLKTLSERVRGLGLKMGLWVEPEMVSEDSHLYRAHPEWCLRIPGRAPVRGRYQLNLDITRPEVRKAVMEPLCKIIEECHISYVKWDFNRNLGNVFSGALPADRQGEVFHRYVLGLYEMQGMLTDRFPDLLLENCAGGGGRFDAGLLYFSPQIWCSDNTDAIDRLTIQYGTSFGYPVSTMGSHVSVCPNHQTGRTAPFETRALVASVGTFGFELDLGMLTEEEKELAKKWLAIYRQDEELVQRGSYYRLSNPAENREFAAWQLVSEDGSRTVVSLVLLRSQANTPIFFCYLKGLEPGAMYRNTEDGSLYSGSALMAGGLPLPITHGDYVAVRFTFERV